MSIDEILNGIPGSDYQVLHDPHAFYADPDPVTNINADLDPDLIRI
jgi:hypothetical protein